MPNYERGLPINRELTWTQLGRFLHFSPFNYIYTLTKHDKTEYDKQKAYF